MVLNSWDPDKQCYRCGLLWKDTPADKKVWVPMLHRVEDVHYGCVKRGQKYQLTEKLGNDAHYGYPRKVNWISKGRFMVKRIYNYREVIEGIYHTKEQANLIKRFVEARIPTGDGWTPWEVVIVEFDTEKKEFGYGWQYGWKGKYFRQFFNKEEIEEKFKTGKVL